MLFTATTLNNGSACLTILDITLNFDLRQLQMTLVTVCRSRLCFRASLYTRTARNVATMPLKFAANISMMFQEIPTLVQRYKAAKDAGFRFVECTFPYNESVESLRGALQAAGLEQVLINGYAGDLAKGDLGLAALPDRITEFREKLELSIQYAKSLNCERMHIMAGKKPEGADTTVLKKMEETFFSNLKYTADRLQKEGIMAVIEAVNTRLSVPQYFLSHPHQALDYVKRINHPNLKIQFDFFHVQIMDGNLTQNLREQFPYIGHIQISQVPDRGEPDTNGEIAYPYVFSVLEKMGYTGYIGLEYKPRGDTVEGLKWFRDLGY